MKTLKVVDGDYVYESGRLVWLTGVEALAQILRNRVALFLGEWFAEPTAGVDWFTLLEQKAFPEKRIQKAVRAAIAADPRVTRVVSVTSEFSRSTRTVSIEFSCETTEGLVSSEVSL
jgi:hypothetical protein